MTTRRLYRFITFALTGIVSLTLHKLDRYEDHWWWDNLSHFCAGFALGVLMGDTDDIDRRFIAIATLWECYEWASKMPRSMGDDGWCLDRKIEDTILDTYVGLSGARLAYMIFNR